MTPPRSPGAGEPRAPARTLTRRAWLQTTAGGTCAALAAGLPTQASAQAPGAGEGAGRRVALLIGNRSYPANQDLPPMHTNVARVAAALRALEFEVATVLDAARENTLRAVEAFGQRLQALPADGTALFFFCGHGLQIDAENFLLPAGTHPRFRNLEESLRLYVSLQKNVLTPWPDRPAGQMITVIDACRVSASRLENVQDDGLNQVRARPGEMIVFSTSGGKPALAPLDPRRMTFFTAEWVRQMEQQAAAPEDLDFRELFRSVAIEVQRTMRNHPLEDIRELAQVPYIADHVRHSERVAPRAAPRTADSAPDEAQALAALQAALWPAEVLRLARAFLERHPASSARTAVRVAAEGAAEAAGLLRRSGINLYPRDVQPRPELGPAFEDDMRRALRGDGTAAARVGARLLAADPTAHGRSYTGWMELAAALGNGIAAYDLARHYRDRDQPAAAGTWEARARELGYVIPPGLRLTR